MSDPEDEERYLTIEGRRWRRSDPSIPPDVREELVAELMSARRAVRTDAVAARPRVHDAKLALGERGDPWWSPTDEGRLVRLAATVRTLRRHRGPDAALDPAEMARVVAGDQWRTIVDAARQEIDTGG